MGRGWLGTCADASRDALAVEPSAGVAGVSGSADGGTPTSGLRHWRLAVHRVASRGTKKSGDKRSALAPGGLDLEQAAGRDVWERRPTSNDVAPG